MPANADPAAIRDRLRTHPIGEPVAVWLLGLDPVETAQVRARLNGKTRAKWDVSADLHRLSADDLLNLANLVVEMDPGDELRLDRLDGTGTAMGGGLSRRMPGGTKDVLANRGGGGALAHAVLDGDPQIAAVVHIISHMVESSQQQGAALRGVVGDLSAALIRAQAGGEIGASLRDAWREIADLRADLARREAELYALRLAAAEALTEAAESGGEGPGKWIESLGEHLGPIMEMAGPIVLGWLAQRNAGKSENTQA